jgi:tryptophan halogenase
MNDRAWAANIPYEDKDRELQSYTNCTTLENGWLWNIPIWSRIGTGYVYSSKFVDDETALKQYKDGLRKVYGSRADEIEARPIKFNSGVREKPWHKNVVSIGLSCGFLEPLNSTGLMMTHDNVIRLVTLLSMKNFEINQIDKDIFNKNCREQILSMKDFILTRYALARRNDTPYWKHVTQNLHYDNGDSVVFSDFGKINELFYLIHYLNILTIKKF